MAFRIAMTATPTSAKTASHIVAIPIAPRMSTNALTTSANMMFSLTITRVFFAILTAEESFEAVSYTHLDVYKRQGLSCLSFGHANMLFQH